MAAHHPSYESLSHLASELRSQKQAIAHIGIFDLNAYFRERRIRIDNLETVFGENGTFVNVLPRWDTGEKVQHPGPFVGEQVNIDLGSCRPYPFEEDAVLLIADYAGISQALSPRELLREQLAKATNLGYGIRAAFEFEFFVLDENGQSLRDTEFSVTKKYAPENHCWAGETGAVYAEFIAALESDLIKGGIEPLSVGSELGPGCFEITLQQTNPLRAADDAAFLKLFTKANCRRQNRTASFMAQMTADSAGLSGHLHLSLFELATGKPVFPDPTEENGMGKEFSKFVAGVLNLVPDGLAFSHHTVNSYRRHAKGNWAPRVASWAVQDYAAGIRVVPEPTDQCRMEYRLPGADTNPYMTLAFVLGAGLHGIETNLELPPPLTSSVGSDTGHVVGKPLPHDLYEASTRLNASQKSREIFGSDFVDYLVSACVHECEETKRYVSNLERQRYLEIV